MRISSSYFTQKTAADIMRRQTELAKIQEQVATGKLINRPSDDPAVASTSSQLRQSSEQLEQYNRNGDFAEARLAMEETALTSVSNVLLRMKELALAANNDTVGASDSRAYLVEVEQQLSELIDYANTKDSNGDYLFSGNKTNIRPFVGTSQVDYTGDDEAQKIQIGEGRSVASSDSGADVFLRIRNGNGDFSVETNSANTGTGMISQATIIDSGQVQTAEYNVVFTSDTTFDVINNSSGATVITGASYEAEQSIEFEGLQITLSGEPQSGDQFAIKPSRNQDLFETVNQFIDLLGTEPTNSAEKAQRQQGMNTLIGDLNQAFEHVVNKRSEVGTRLRYIDSSREENSSIKDQVDRTLSGFEDLDYADAVTRLQGELTALQALQSTFSKLQNLSLFNYL